MTVNDAVAKRVVNLLAEKNMTLYRLEQNSGIQHGHMQWIATGDCVRTRQNTTIFALFVKLSLEVRSVRRRSTLPKIIKNIGVLVVCKSYLAFLD